MFWILLAAEAEAAPTGGCIGHPLNECLAQLRTVARLDESLLAGQLSRAVQTDVNGKPLGGADTVVAEAYFGPSSYRSQTITISRDAAGDVSKVSVVLPGQPEFARTADEYEKSGLGQAFKAVLPPSCTSDDLAAFKFFENEVKPTISHGQKQTEIDETHAETSSFNISSTLPYCGVDVRFSSLFGHSTESISEYNDDGAFFLSEITFSRPESRSARAATHVRAKHR